MSDMLEHGASGGAGPLPPSESHDEFLELCATATTGSLSADERGRLKNHLAQCDFCREIMAQYQAIVDGVIPAWAANSAEEKPAPSAWSQDEAEARLFARLGESESFSIPREPVESRRPPSSPAPPKVPASSGDALWRHMWVQFAAALLLVASLGLIAYRTGMRRGLDLAPHDVKLDSVSPAAQEAGNYSPQSALKTRLTDAQKTNLPDPQVAALRSELEARLAEITVKGGVKPGQCGGVKVGQ
jgi:hypothetical protein